MKDAEYRDLVAGYLERHFGPRGLVVYTEVPVGKTIIGKNRRLDVLALRRDDQRVLAVECKWQEVRGTTDEKIPYALADLEAMWIPGCLAYAGPGWSRGVLHTLEGSRLAVHCEPAPPDLLRTSSTLELDHVVGAVFGLWDLVLPERRLYSRTAQLGLPLVGPKKSWPRRPDEGKGEVG